MIRAPKRQLYTLSRRDFAAPSYVDHDGRLFTRPANDLPLVFWPDGSWCHVANTYIRQQFEKGLSRNNKGGTVAVSASHISHLIRFCWNRKVELLALTDNEFSAFIGELILERKPRDPSRKAREGNSVLAIGRSCLEFLDSIGRQAGDTEFVGESGRIMAIRKSHEVKTREGTKSRTIKKVSYWDHHSFPEPSALKRRLPISTANIEKLRQAVGTMSTSPHQRMRRHCTLKLLEVTGARRGEIALIETQFVKNAGEMEMPMLRVPTLKKRRSSPPYRFVPISRSDIEFIMQYVEVHRRAVVRRKLRGQSDHGFLLVGEDGMPYQPNSITQEVRKLARHAGIDEVACPHMFRHRFFTKLFVALIEQHQSENPDCFRQLLIDGESLKRKVLEWSGQSSIESLDHYIDLAFDEIGNYKKVYNLANVGLALDSFQGTLEAEMQAIGQGEAPFLVAERLIRQITSLRNALDAAKAVA